MEDTLTHEIAHAIDFEVRNKSNHDAHWANIHKTLGGSGRRRGTGIDNTKVEYKHYVGYYDVRGKFIMMRGLSRMTRNFKPENIKRTFFTRYKETCTK